MSYRYRYENSIQSGQQMPNERRLMIGMLVTFVLVSLVIIWAGRLPVRPGVTPLDGPSYQTYVADDRQLLSSYGNTLEGAVHIPIDRAMDLIAERGLPTRTTTASTP
jgi:hypothetical protein